ADWPPVACRHHRVEAVLRAADRAVGRRDPPVPGSRPAGWVAPVVVRMGLPVPGSRPAGSADPVEARAVRSRRGPGRNRAGREAVPAADRTGPRTRAVRSRAEHRSHTDPAGTGRAGHMRAGRGWAGRVAEVL